MHVMPDDDVFFITDVKIEDMGVYSCTAQNSAGSVLANATLTVLGKMPESRWKTNWSRSRNWKGSVLQQLQKWDKEAMFCVFVHSFIL